MLLQEDGDRATGDAGYKIGGLHCVAVRQMTKTAIGVRESCCVAGTLFIIYRFVLRVIVVSEMLRGAARLVFAIETNRGP